MEDATPSCSNSESQPKENGFEEIDISDIDNLEIPPLPAPFMNFDGTGPRLLITHIVNENFKSYAGRHILGPFHKNYTAIVGPNGSGKSNVIDSLLFVFGYRANKIRSKKIGVLIHNSEKYPNINSCTVEIHFLKAIDKNEHDYDIVEGSGFYVSRTAFKDSTSEYRLNGRRVQFREIGALLREMGIDLDHNRFLILQGEVEQIALMKPKALQDGDQGMLEYLEDIVGSSRLVEPIAKLNQRCEELNELRTEKANRVKVVESEKMELEASKDEAVEYLLLENEIIKKKNMLYHIYMLKAEDNCQEMNEELVKIREEYKEHEERMKEVKQDIAKKKADYANAKKALDDLTSSAEKHQSEFAKMEKDDAKAREDLKHCKNKSKKLATSIENEKKKLEELKALPEKAEAQVEELNKKIKDLEKKKPTLEAELQKGTAKLRQETSELQTLKETAENELAKVQEEVNEARSKVDIAQSELDVCLSAQTKEIKKLEELNAKLKELVDSRTARQDVLAKSEEEFERAENSFREIQQHLREVANEETTLAEKLKNDRSKVEEARCAMQSNQGRSTVLSALLEEKRKGTIPGIIGRLGDLGAIDEKYDIAISTACGPLDNIVVDSIDTAQICVNFLKKRNLGQATFIGLDKMQRFANAVHQPIQTPENVPRLFDLIKVEDESVLPAFYFALRDTLVAPNLEQATRISLQGRVRWRVVTLQGHLIDTSGTMSGGGNRPSKGRMGRSVVASAAGAEISVDRLKEMDEELNQIAQKLQTKRRERNEFEKKLDNLSRESQRLKLQIDKCRAESLGSNEEESRLKKQIIAKERTVKNTVIDENERKRLEKRVSDFKKEYDRIDSSANKIREKVDKYHKQIMEISEKLVGTVQKKLDNCQKELDECRKNITKANVSVKNSERNLAKTEEQIAKLEQELNENEENRKKLKELLTQLEGEGLKTVEAWEKIKAGLAEKEKICVEVKKELDLNEDKEQQLSATAMDKRQKLDHAERVLKEYTQKMTHWKKEIKKLKLNDLRDLKPISFGKVPDKESQSAENESEEAENDENSEEDEEMDSESEENEEKRRKKRTKSVENEKNVDKNYDKRYDEVELVTYDEETIRKYQEKSIIFKLTVDEDNLKSMKPNISAIEEYRKKLSKYNDCIKQLEHVTNTRDKYRAKYEQLKKQRLMEFMTGFRVIATRLKEMYQMITLGGDADLDLVDTMDPFSEGIAFSVRPPKKSWKQISNLSGGEKTLSSLALVFALHHYKPTPLYVMDEIDAALDFRNVSIVASYIKERTKNAQFIIISLRNNMFELSDRLVGIYKTYNCTKSVTIDPDKICKREKVEGEKKLMTTPVKYLRLTQPAV